MADGRWKCPHCDVNAAPLVALARKVAALNPDVLLSPGVDTRCILTELVSTAATALKGIKP